MGHTGEGSRYLVFATDGSPAAAVTLRNIAYTLCIRTQTEAVS